MTRPKLTIASNNPKKVAEIQAMLGPLPIEVNCQPSNLNVDETGSTYVGGNGFGEIAMQIQGGTIQGIDTGYSGDNETLENRANEISNDDGSGYPVHFSDNDRDGKLSSGDQFLVYGPSSGPAEDGWRLHIQYDPSYNIIGSAKLL